MAIPTGRRKWREWLRDFHVGRTAPPKAKKKPRDAAKVGRFYPDHALPRVPSWFKEMQP